jgi:superfamily I DNA/RNA helicase
VTKLQFAGVDNEDLLAAIAGDMAAWRVWLHPTQLKLADHDGWNGPFRVTGGAGTGKTVTALHRAGHLAGRIQAQGANEKVLLATFTKSLAAALKIQLMELAGRDVLNTVDVTHLDSLARRIITQHSPGDRFRPVGDESGELRQGWDVATAGQNDWTGEFLIRE